MSETVEWCVMHPDYPDEPHRGPMSEDQCRAWVEQVNAGRDAGFYVARRLVGPWKKSVIQRSTACFDTERSV